MTEHTDACVYARQGIPRTPGREEERPDYPHLWAVRTAHGEEGVDAVLACPHPDHDTVRWFVLGRRRP